MKPLILAKKRGYFFFLIYPPKFVGATSSSRQETCNPFFTRDNKTKPIIKLMVSQVKQFSIKVKYVMHRTSPQQIGFMRLWEGWEWRYSCRFGHSAHSRWTEPSPLHLLIISFSTLKRKVKNLLTHQIY